MNVTILGTNGFLSRAIAIYCNKKGYFIDMYGLNEPKGHRYHQFHRIDLMKDELPYHEIIQSDIIVYAIGAGIQSNLKEENGLIYNLNVTVPVKICNELKKHCFKGVFITFGSVFEIGETKEEHFFTEHEILTSTSPSPNDYTTSKRMLSRFVDSSKHEFTYWHFFLPTIMVSQRILYVLFLILFMQFKIMCLCILLQETRQDSIFMWKKFLN